MGHLLRPKCHESGRKLKVWSGGRKLWRPIDPFPQVAEPAPLEFMRRTWAVPNRGHGSKMKLFNTDIYDSGLGTSRLGITVSGARA